MLGEMTANYQESLLIERSLSGDRQAYGELVTRHQGRVMGVAYAVTADVAVAEEVAQDALRFPPQHGQVDYAAS